MKRLDRENPSEERAMRDRMNGIQRDKDGKITHRNWKPIEQKKDEHQ
jgi:hypothetical protein